MSGLLPDDVLANYTFAIECDSTVLATFDEVNGLTSEVGVIEHRANKPGGKSVLRKLPGLAKYGDIELKHGMTQDKALSDWHKQVLDGDMKSARRNGSIILYAYDHGEVVRFNFTNAWISKLSLGQVTAKSNEVLVQSATLVHEGLMLA